MKLDKESFKTYAAVLNGVASGTDVLIEALMEAHNIVASLPAVAETVTVYVEGGIEKAITVLSRYGDALEMRLIGHPRNYGQSRQGTPMSRYRM